MRENNKKLLSIMSECRVPKWKLRLQGDNISSLLYPRHNLPRSDYEVAELTWENGQLAMLGGNASTTPQKATSTWVRTGDTLESIVRQATSHKQCLNFEQNDQKLTNTNTIIASDIGNLGETSGNLQIDPSFPKKRTRSESDRYDRDFSTSVQGSMDRSACASVSETYCFDDIDTTMLTYASFESTRSLKTKTTHADSIFLNGSENQEEEWKTKGETVHSHSTRRRSAATHNQSERKRRDRINEKMKALQRLVPNANKTDKASMLDEVIEYLKKLQTQVQMMSVRSIPQMMMPMGMQQQIQMSLLARMGMGFGLGMGMGMADMNMARASPQSLSPLVHPTPVSPSNTSFTPPFAGHPMVPRPIPSQTASPSSSAPFTNPYCSFYSQAMNIDLYNKMAALYQQVNQGTQATSSPSQSNNVKGKRDGISCMSNSVGVTKH